MKRTSKNQIIKGHSDDEDEDTVPKEFQRASTDVLARRQIAMPKRRNIGMGTNSTLKPTSIIESKPSVSSTSQLLSDVIDKENMMLDYAKRVVGLNKGFISVLNNAMSVDESVDLSVLCHDYLKFRKLENEKANTVDNNIIKAPKKTETNLDSDLFTASKKVDINHIKLEPVIAQKHVEPVIKFAAPPKPIVNDTPKPFTGFSFGKTANANVPAPVLPVKASPVVNENNKPAETIKPVGTDTPQITSLAKSPVKSTATPPPSKRKVDDENEKPTASIPFGTGNSAFTFGSSLSTPVAPAPNPLGFSFGGTSIPFSAVKDTSKKDDTGLGKFEVKPMESKDTSTSKPTSFSFGSKPDMKDSKLEETKETKPFSFGASLDKDSGPTFGKPPTFSFGAKPNESTSTTETKGFSFGAKASESASNTETKAFSFGAKASESASTTETKGFSFGAKTSESASTTETKGFSFGASLNKGESQATDKNSTEKPTAATGSGSFSFGSFTNKNTETVVKDSSDDKKESAPKPFSFGNDPSKKPSTGFDFSSKPAGSESKPSMFSFSNTQAPASNSTTSFGVSSTNSESKPFTFGSIPVATNSFSTSSTQGSASTGGTSGFSFQTAATATDSKNPTSTFNFSNLGTPKPLSSTFQFSLGTQPPVNTEATANAETTGGEEGDAMEALPQVGDALMKGEGEENEDTLNSIKVKIFTEGEAVGKWDSIGVGLLKLNQAKDKKSSRLLCRADQSGRVLINASVYSKMPIVKSNEKNFTIILQVEGEMKKFLIRSGKDSDLVGFFDNVTKVRDQL